MARLNLTIPDPLYERLEQVRDRLNVSKICAQALEKELTMLEHPRLVDETKIALVLSRLQTIRERWRQRGWDDGVQWATETATRDELRIIATEMAEWDGKRIIQEARPNKGAYATLAALAAVSTGMGSPRRFPSSFPLDEHLEKWTDSSDDVEVDESAYLEGWRDAIKEIWEAVSPSLQ